MRRISGGYRDSVTRCESQDLTASAFRGNLVLVRFRDDYGNLLWPDAFCRIDPEDDGYVWVMTEHRGYHVYARDEIVNVVELKPVRAVDGLP